VPPYADSLPGAKLNFWQFPYYDKESFYLIGKWDVGQDRYLKSRLYYDAFVRDSGLGIGRLGIGILRLGLWRARLSWIRYGS
jgi:hypothetical protein